MKLESPDRLEPKEKLWEEQACVLVDLFQKKEIQPTMTSARRKVKTVAKINSNNELRDLLLNKAMNKDLEHLGPYQS